MARCTVERLVRPAGVVQGRKIRTTTADPGGERAQDLVQRDFTAQAPNRCWVADFTHVAPFAGVVYVAFVVDVYSRAIVGWSAATTKHTTLVLNALDMGLWRRDRDGRPVEAGLIHHSDAGSQGGLNRSSQHLVITEVFDGASSAVGGSGSATGDAFTGPADAGAACGARVLAPDRAGQAD